MLYFQAKTTNIEVVVTKENGENSEEPTDGVVVENNGSDNESTEMNDAETAWDEEPLTENENEEPPKENNSSEEELEALTKVDEEKGAEEVETTDKKNEEAAEAVEKEIEEETTLANADTSENISGHIQGGVGSNENGNITQVSEEPAVDSTITSPNVVKLSSSEMVVVGCLCSYLQICPYGATTDQVLTHITRQVPGVTPDDLERILNGLPMLFSGDGLDFMSKTWKFNVVNV